MGTEASTAASKVLRSLTCTIAKMMSAVRPIFPASKTQLMQFELRSWRSIFAVNWGLHAMNAKQKSRHQVRF